MDRPGRHEVRARAATPAACEHGLSRAGRPRARRDAASARRHRSRGRARKACPAARGSGRRPSRCRSSCPDPVGQALVELEEDLPETRAGLGHVSILSCCARGRERSLKRVHRRCCARRELLLPGRVGRESPLARPSRDHPVGNRGARKGPRALLPPLSLRSTPTGDGTSHAGVDVWRVGSAELSAACCRTASERAVSQARPRRPGVILTGARTAGAEAGGPRWPGACREPRVEERCSHSSSVRGATPS